MPRHYKDLTGQKFNRLTAKEYLGHSRWRCECECGNTRDVPSYALTLGRIVECQTCSGTKTSNKRGPKRQIDYTGQRFGKLVCQKSLGNQVWEFKCDCGETMTLSERLMTLSAMPTMCAKCTINNRFLKHVLQKANMAELTKNLPITYGKLCTDGTAVFVAPTATLRDKFAKQFGLTPIKQVELPKWFSKALPFDAIPFKGDWVHKYSPPKE